MHGEGIVTADGQIRDVTEEHCIHEKAETTNGSGKKRIVIKGGFNLSPHPYSFISPPRFSSIRILDSRPFVSASFKQSTHKGNTANASGRQVSVFTKSSPSSASPVLGVLSADSSSLVSSWPIYDV